MYGLYPQEKSPWLYTGQIWTESFPWVRAQSWSTARSWGSYRFTVPMGHPVALL